MPHPTTALSNADIQQRLQRLPHWGFTGNALERIYDGPNYLASVETLNQIARLSEEADHHPDLTLNWKKLTIRYWTHTAQGVTDLDFKLAEQVESLLSGT